MGTELQPSPPTTECERLSPSDDARCPTYVRCCVTATEVVVEAPFFGLDGSRSARTQRQPRRSCQVVGAHTHGDVLGRRGAETRTGAEEEGGFLRDSPLFGGCKYTGAKCGLVDETCRSTRVSPHRCPSCLCQFHSPGTVITLEPFLEHSGGSKHGFHGNISVDKRIGAAVFL